MAYNKRVIQATTAMIAVCIFLITLLVWVRESGATDRAVPTSAMPMLRAIAARMANTNGASAAQVTTEAVLTTRQAAASLVSGDRVDTNQAVYLLQLHGTFVGYMAKVPKGAPVPKGTALTVTVDVRTGRITDWDLSYRSEPLSHLGPVTAVS